MGGEGEVEEDVKAGPMPDGRWESVYFGWEYRDRCMDGLGT